MKINKNKKLVQWPNVDLDEKPHPMEIFYYTRDKDTDMNQKLRMVTRSIVPIPTQRSPIYVLLNYNEKVQPWTQRFTNTYESITQLESILRCYCEAKVTIFYERNSKLCDEIFEMFKKGLDNIAEAHLEGLKQEENRNSKKKFKRLMITTTYRYIHLLEKCLYKLYIEPCGRLTIKLEDCLTPINYEPGSINLPPDLQAMYEKVMKNYFLDKDHFITELNERVTGAKGEKKQFFKGVKTLWEDYLQFEIFQVQLSRLKK